MLKITFGFLIFGLGIIKAISDPFWGLVAFSLFTHIPPQQLSETVIAPLRVSFVLSIITLFSYFVSSKYKNKFSRWPLETILMLMMVISMKIGAMNAEFNPNLASERTFTYFKYLIFFILMTNIINTKYKIDWFTNGLILSAAWLVYRCWDLRGTTGVRFENRGGGVIGDSNQFAAACILLLPIVARKIFFDRLYLKIGALLGTFGLIMTVIITGSRAGFLGLATTFIAFMIFYKERRKKIFIILIVVSFVVMPFMPEYYINRISTIFGTEDQSVAEIDASASSRLESWSLSYDLWKERPFFGTGLGNFSYYFGYLKEGKEYGEPGHVAHSLWFEAIGEGGLFVFCPLLAMIFLFFYRTMKTSKKFILQGNYSIAEDIYAFQIGMVGFLVAASFVNRLIYEPIYWWCAIAICYSDIQKKGAII